MTRSRQWGKDHESATEEIAADSKAVMAAYGKRSGPAAKACTIQTKAKRHPADEKTNITFARIAAPSSQRQHQKYEAKKQAGNAEVKHGLAMARIANGCNLARAECKKRKSTERTECKNKVDSGTADAQIVGIS
jgi:hypothetical protein